MSKTGIMTLPLLRGTVAAAGPWQSLYAKQNYRVYPYQLGCLVRSDNSGGSFVLTHGMGQFLVNNYLIACSPTNYGNSTLYVPDLNRIVRVATFGANAVATQAAADDDRLNFVSSVTLYEGDYLLNLGNDSSPAPTTTPNYDGSTVTIYDDNVGNNSISGGYVLTGQGGNFYCWLESGTQAVDVLVQNTAGVPVVALPFLTAGAEIL